MGFLDNLEKYNKAKAGGAPTINPPEASKVLATETAAEVANEKAPSPAESQTVGAASSAAHPSASDDAPGAPAEQPKTRTRRSRTNAAGIPASAAPESADTTLTQAIELVACLLPSGSEIKITGRG